MTEFGMVPQVEEKHISSGSATAFPKFTDPLSTPKRLSNEIWYNTHGGVACFQGSGMTQSRGQRLQNFWDPQPTPKRFDL